MKIKVTITILAILLVVSLSGVAYLYIDNTASENELTTRLADQETVISDLQSTNAQLETKTSELEQTIVELEKQLADLQSVNDELQETIIGLQEEITEATYFKEAEELWELNKPWLDTNWETFREAYTLERINGSTKDEALEKMYELFPLQPKQSTQQQQQQPKPESETSTQQPIPNDLSFDEIDKLLGLPEGSGRIDYTPGVENGCTHGDPSVGAQ